MKVFIIVLLGQCCFATSTTNSLKQLLNKYKIGISENSNLIISPSLIELDKEIRKIIISSVSFFDVNHIEGFTDQFPIDISISNFFPLKEIDVFHFNSINNIVKLQYFYQKPFLVFDIKYKGENNFTISADPLIFYFNSNVILNSENLFNKKNRFLYGSQYWFFGIENIKNNSYIIYFLAPEGQGSYVYLRIYTVYESKFLSLVDADEFCSFSPISTISRNGYIYKFKCFKSKNTFIEYHLDINNPINYYLESPPFKRKN